MKACVLSLLALMGAAASAQTVYRCGPEGRDYSQVPCPHGRVVDVSDGRDLGQREQAAALARQERLLGDSLTRERAEREAAITPATAHAFHARTAEPWSAEPVEPDSRSHKKKRHTARGAGKRSDFKAVAPGSTSQAKRRPG